MLNLTGKNRYRKLTACALFILLTLWTSSEPTSGSGITLPSIAGTFNLKAATAGEFSVITYNIAGLPAIISSAVTERSSSIAEIGKRLNRFDIAHVQEDFNYNDDLYEQGNTHPFRSTTMGGVPFGDGLNTLSRYPVRELRRISWNDCTGADCLTPKGFTYSSIEVAKNVFIDFYNIHANAYNDVPAAAARRRNIAQLSGYIRDHSKGNAVIVMGDLNGRYGYIQDNVRLLHTKNGLLDAWVFHKRTGRLPAASRQIPASNILDLMDTHETIDKILYCSSRNLILKTTVYQLEKELFLTGQGIPLSDHHPVSAKFSWSVIREEQKEIALKASSVK